MTAIEKLIFELNGLIKESCGQYMIKPRRIASLIEEYESTPKPWAPPWALRIPDWALWFTVDAVNRGYVHEAEPFAEVDYMRWASRGMGLQIGYFEIPPGVDWRDMKVRVR